MFTEEARNEYDLDKLWVLKYGFTDNKRIEDYEIPDYIDFN